MSKSIRDVGLSSPVSSESSDDLMLSKKTNGNRKRSPGRPKLHQDALAALDTQQEILQKAKKLFMKSGYAAVSISQIVDVVGITKPSLYYYFEDKEHLYTEVLAESLRHGGEYVAMGLKQGQNLEEKLVALTTGFYHNAPAALSLLLHDAKEQLSEARFEEVFAVYQNCILAPFVQLFDKARHTEVVIPTDSDPKLMAILFLSMIDTARSQLKTFYADSFSAAKMAQETVSLFLNGLRTR